MTRYFSQTGEDFLLWRLFRDNNTGFFIDVGAFDGVHLSNSYSFELEGWRGICVEAHPVAFELCRMNRPHSFCINAACLDDSSKRTVTFFAEGLGLLSGIEPDREADVENRYKNRSLKFSGFEKHEVPATTLNGILEELEFESNIDFISIDVEGSELKVLQGFDLKRYCPRVVVVEANDDVAEIHMDAYMKSFAYHKARKIGPNIFYCKTKQDRNVISRTAIDCQLESTVHPLGEEYTIQRRLRYRAREKSVFHKLRKILKSIRKD